MSTRYDDTEEVPNEIDSIPTPTETVDKVETGNKNSNTIEARPFPIDLLPDDIRNFVIEISREYQTPEEMVFQACLTAISYSTRNVWSIRTAQKYVEPLQLWTMTLAEPGERKGVMSKALEPIRTAEAKAMQKYLDDLDWYRTITVQQVKQLNKEVEKLYGDSGIPDDVKLIRSREIRDKLKKLQEPTKPTYIATDTTTEGLAKELQKNHESIVIADTEATILKTLGGIYNNKGQTNLGFINKTYMCEYHSVSRASGDPVVLNLPFTAIGLFIQPETVDKLWDTDFVGTGFFQRFLFAIPKTRLGYRNTDPDAADVGVVETWNKKVTALLEESISLRETNSFISMSDLSQLNFSDEAYRRYREFVAQFELRFRPDGDLVGTIAGWASKLPGTLARIAANLALFDGEKAIVGLKYLECALDLAEFYIDHAKKLFGVMSGTTSIGRDSTLQQEIIIKWIVNNSTKLSNGNPEAFTIKNVTDHVRNWKGPFKIPYGKCRELVSRTLEELVSEARNNWIIVQQFDHSDQTEQVEQTKQGKHRGRGQPTLKYLVYLDLMEEELGDLSKYAKTKAPSKK